MTSSDEPPSDVRDDQSDEPDQSGYGDGDRDREADRQSGKGTEPRRICTKCQSSVIADGERVEAPRP